MTKTRAVSGSVSESDLEEGSSFDDHIRDTESSLKTHLEDVHTCVDQLLRQIKSLRKENKSLKQRRKRDEEQIPYATPTRAGRSEAKSLGAQIAELKAEVEELRTKNEKQRRKIEKLKQKELEAEAEDLRTREKLTEHPDDGEIDPEYRMRKLLRKFADLMSINTIAEDSSEECVICFKPFVTKKCSSLSCQHIICNDCLPMVSRGADETIHCPLCRGVTDRNGLELVHMTEKERWDKLLEIAQAWAAWDHVGEMETSEEESEENFSLTATGCESESSGPAMDVGNTSDDEPLVHETSKTMDGEDDGSDVSSYTPRRLRSRPATYNESPIKEKRKRLEQLAEERERVHKRRR